MMSDPVEPDEVEVWFTDGEGVAESFWPESIAMEYTKHGIMLVHNDYIDCIPIHVINRIRIGSDVTIE